MPKSNFDANADFDQTFFELFTRFINISAQEVDQELITLFKLISKKFLLDQILAFEIDQKSDGIERLFKWENSESDSLNKAPQILNLSDFPEWIGWLEQNKILNFSDVSALYSGKEASILGLERECIQSLLIVPVINLSTLTHIAVFASVDVELHWTDQEVAQLEKVSRILSRVEHPAKEDFEMGQSLHPETGFTEIENFPQVSVNIMEEAPDAIILENSEGKIIKMNKSARQMLGNGKKLGSTTLVTLEHIPLYQLVQNLNDDQEGIQDVHDIFLREISGGLVPVEISASSFENQLGEYYVSVLREISHRKRSEEKVSRQMQYLSKIREIDRLIMENRDLEIVLQKLLDFAIVELMADAGDFVIWDSAGEEVKITVTSGYQEFVLKKMFEAIPASKDCIVVKNKGKLHIPDLQNPSKPFKRAAFLAENGFRGYLGVPLIAGNKVRGLMEFYSCKSLEMNKEQQEQLEGLVWQSLIAIDNSEMFWGMLQSNSELTIAYDTTLEGWARALELRDFETGGHTFRVSDLTVTIAGQMGIDPEQIQHVYRGAVLHDIGKLAIPDKILLKPGRLTPEERKIMEEHPMHAYNMLSEINYLSDALDIPHYHHEKWDGTGYPEGLKGEDIPLPARIFSIVDVYDALISDRPYRKGWSIERTLEYIMQCEGTHFDPAVVEVFINYFNNMFGKC